MSDATTRPAGVAAAGPAVTVHQIERSQIAQLGRSMSNAFFDDPLMTFMEPDEAKRRQFGNWFFARAADYCRRWGQVYTDTGVTGGGGWLTPGNTHMSTWRIFRAGMFMMPFKIGMSGMSRFNALDSAASKVHKKVMPGPHWYLLVLGVDPARQKGGLGSALIEAGASQAQKAGLPCYLETMTQSNVDYYTKRGFKVAEEFDVAGKVHTWAMVREPQR